MLMIRQRIILLFYVLTILLTCLMYMLSSQQKMELNAVTKLRNVNVEQSDYDLSIFFIETNRQLRALSLKQTCSIEAAARHNPSARVNVLVLSELVRLPSHLKSAYSNIDLHRLDVNETFAGTPLNKWWTDGRLTKQDAYFEYGHLSDALRLAILYKQMGIYIDLDMITLRSLKPLLNYSGFVSELQGDEIDTGNAFIVQNKKKDPFLWYVMETFEQQYDPESWAENGPFLVKSALESYCKTTVLSKLLLAPNNIPKTEGERFKFKSNQSFCNVHLYPFYVAYPIHAYYSDLYYDHDATLNVADFLYSYLVHLNSFTNKPYHNEINLNEKSLYEFFATFNCPVTYQLLVDGVSTKF